MSYKGVFIQESLGDVSILEKVKILHTRIEKVTPQHKTPWLTQWTLHTIEIQEKNADLIATQISKSFDTDHPDWYADFKNANIHYIVYANKIFKVDIHNPVLYNDAKQYGVSIGIPEYQVDFTPEDKKWER